MISGLSKTAMTVTTWGFNIVSQLAVGIVKGASTVLVTAMNFIGQILSAWLQPHSPPQVAPEIDTWGIQTMNTYLQGFTDADFGILKDVQSPIKEALSNMVTADLIDEDASANIAKSITMAMSEALSSGAGIGEAIQKAKESLGPYGEQIAVLIEKEFALSAAQQAVADAENALSAAQQKQTKDTTRLTEVVDEYNALARSGASKAVLAAKRAEFRQQKETAKQSVKDTATAEANLDVKKTELETVKESINLQKQLVDQLLDFSKVSAEALNTGAASDLADALSEIGDVFDDIGGGVGSLEAQLELFRQNIKNKFADLFKPLTDGFAEIQIELDKLKKPFDKFFDTIKKAYEDKIKPIFSGQLFDDLKEALKSGSITDIVKAFWRWMTDPTNGALVQVGQKMNSLATSIYSWTVGPEAQAYFTAIGKGISRGILNFVFGGNDPEVSAQTTAALLRFIGNMASTVAKLMLSFNEIGRSITRGIMLGIIEQVESAFGGSWSASLKSALTEGLISVFSSINPLALIPNLVSVIKAAIAAAIAAAGAGGSGGGGGSGDSGGGSGGGDSGGGGSKKKRAYGGTVRAGESAWTGESGPELIFPGRTATIVSSRRILSALKTNTRATGSDAQMASTQAYTPANNSSSVQWNMNVNMPTTSVSTLQQGFEAMRLMS
jgi:hypothetical protein